MILTAENTTTLSLTLTRKEAERILCDFDDKREPSEPTMRLVFALASIARRETDRIAKSDETEVDPDDLCLTCGATNGVCGSPKPAEEQPR